MAGYDTSETSLGELWDATRLNGEGVASRWGGLDPRANEFLHRATQWVMIDASLNARSCSQAKIRLYRKATGKRSRRFATRSVPPSRLRMLRNPGVVGVKQAAAFDDTSEEVTRHPVLDMLSRPNHHTSGVEYAEQRALSREIFGTAYTVKIRAGGDGSEVVELHSLMPQYVAVVPGDTTLIDGYRYGRNRSKIIDLAPEDVIRQMHAQSPWNPYYGMPPLLSVIKSVDRMDASEEWAIAIYRNMGRPDYVIKAPAETGVTALKELELKFERRLRGPANAGKPVAVAGVEVVPIGWTPRDMQDMQSRSEAEAMIHAAYGVPPSFARLNDANLASSRTGYIQYYTSTIMPRLVKDADDLTTQLLPDFGLEPGEYWLAYDPISRDEESGRAAMLTQYVGAGVLTPNEARAELAYEPIEGGDGLRDVGGGLGLGIGAGPVAGDGTTDDPVADVAASPAVAVVEPLNGAQIDSLRTIISDIASGAIPAESGRALIAAAFPSLAAEQVDAIIDPLAGFEPLSPDAGAASPAPAQAEEVTKARKDRGTDAGLERAIKEWFASVSKQLGGVMTADRIRSIMEQARKEFPSYTDDALVELFASGYNRGVSDVRDARPDMGAFALDDTQASEYLGRHRIKLARSVTGTYERALSDTIAKGIEDGLSTDQIADALQRVAEDLSGPSAERIARTEVARAQVGGRLAAWEESGVVEGKEWLLSSDPCELCRAMAAAFNASTDNLDQVLPLGSKLSGDMGGEYTIDYSDVDGPPAHPNCTCDLAPRVNAEGGVS